MHKCELALKYLQSPRWPMRQRGMRELVLAGKTELALQYALAETVPAVLEPLVEALFPEPVELLLHQISVRRRDAGLALRYHLPKGNYLYAERELKDAFRYRALTVDAITGVGLAYMRSFLPMCEREASAPIRSLHDALRTDGAKASRGIKWTLGQDARSTLAAPAQRAIAAGEAVMRLDGELEGDEIRRMLEELRAAIPECAARIIAEDKLQAMLFHVVRGEAPPFRSVAVVPDVAATLIKDNRTAEAVSLMRKHGPAKSMRGEFCFWPVMDVVNHYGLAHLNGPVPDSGHPAYAYLRARGLGLAPPPWWQWLT